MLALWLRPPFRLRWVPQAVADKVAIMQVTAGSSTDEPGKIYSGFIFNFDEKPFWPRYALTAGHGWLSISGSHTIVPRYSLRPQAWWRRHR